MSLKPRTKLRSISEINEKTAEGKYLMMAISKITTESQTDKQPDEVLYQIGELVESVYYIQEGGV